MSPESGQHRGGQRVSPTRTGSFTRRTPKRGLDAVPDLPGQAEQRGRTAAAAMGQRERVLAGDRDAVPAVPLGEAGALDQPGRGRLHPVTVRPLRRHHAVAQPLGDPVQQHAPGVGGQHRVHEERADAAGVRVLGVEHHALAPAQAQHGVPDVAERSHAAGLHAQHLGQLAEPQRPAEQVRPQRVDHLEHHVAIKTLEDTVAVRETTVGRGHRQHLVGAPVVDGDRADRLGHLLPVRTDVLDRGRAGRTGNTGHALDPGQALGDAVRDQLVPAVTCGDGDHDQLAPALGPDPGGAQQDHVTVEAGVRDHHVAAAGQHEHRPTGLVRRTDRLDGLVGVGDLDQRRGGATQPQGGQGAERCLGLGAHPVDDRACRRTRGALRLTERPPGRPEPVESRRAGWSSATRV